MPEGELIRRVFRNIPEDFWDMHIWADTGPLAGSLDVADRKRAVVEIVSKTIKFYDEPHALGAETLDGVPENVKQRYGLSGESNA